MGIRRLYRVQCDECYTAFDWTEWDSKAQAIETVREDGWKVTAWRVLCPECAKESGR